MDQELYSKIHGSSSLFRNTIERMNKTNFPLSSWFERFPLGCCGDTSDLLAKYLTEEHSIETLYVWGMRGEQSHAWLEHKKLIIDITADQFDEVNESVIITTDRTWHSQFVGQNLRSSDFDTFTDRNAVRLRMIYNNILSNMAL